MNIKLPIIILFSYLTFNGFAQPSNDNCANASALCSGVATPGTTAGATNELCNNCADGATGAGSNCFNYGQTVWYEFQTNAAGGSVTINVTSINCASGALSGIIYQAGTPCDQSTYSVVSNCQTNSTTGFSLNANGLAPNTVYYVQISGTGDCSFDATATGNAIAVGNPSITISASHVTVCQNEPVTFTVDNYQDCPGAIFEWMVNGSVVETTSLGTYINTTIGPGDVVSCNMVCPCGGNAKANDIALTVYPNTARAGADAVIPVGDRTQLNGSGGVTYSWKPAESLDDPNIPNPIASPLVTTTYELTITDANGCVFKDWVTITVIDEIVIPNTFTPNGDGVNDTWEILKIDQFPKCKITIYDRWGQQVYNTIGYTKARQWDGTKGGKKLPTSAYYYIIDLNTTVDGTKIYKGSVSIVY